MVIEQSFKVSTIWGFATVTRTLEGAFLKPWESLETVFQGEESIYRKCLMRLSNVFSLQKTSFLVAALVSNYKHSFHSYDRN